MNNRSIASLESAVVYQAQQGSSRKVLYFRPYSISINLHSLELRMEYIGISKEIHAMFHMNEALYYYI